MTRDAAKVLYIAGSGRSGSTLLERMLGHVDGFFTAGELKFTWERGFRDNQLCSCGRPFRECEFWTAVVADAFGGAHEVDHGEMVDLGRKLDRVRYVPQLLVERARTSEFRRSLERYAATTSRLYESIVRVSGCDVVVDSSKTQPYVFALTTIADIELSVVHLVRDSRAVAYSWQQKTRRPEVTSGERYMGGFSPASTARKWNMKNMLSELLRLRAAEYVRVRYEDLVERPEAVLARIVAAAGAPARSIFPDVTSVGVPPLYHSVSGNPIRLEHRPLDIRPDRRWESGMAPGSKALVTSLTFPLLVRYGYLGRRAGVQPVAARA